MTIEIYSYGNLDALHGIFNAVTMIFGASDYLDMVRTCIIVAFMTVATIMVLPGQGWRGANWFVTVVVVGMLLFVPRTSVLITDKLGAQAPVVVGNVPWSLALFGSVKSVIGYTLTNMFEMAFQTIPSANRALPTELSYQNNGLVFGSRLVASARSAKFIDPVLATDIINYNRNCVIPEMGKSINPSTFQSSAGLWGTYQTTNQALFTSYMRAGSYVIDSCGQAYTDLSVSIPGAVTAVRDKMASLAFPEMTAANAAAKFNNALMAAYSKANLTAAASTVSDILLQNMMINSFGDSQQVINVATGNPAAVMLASAKANAVAQMNMSYSTQGSIAEEALPIVRNVTEAILYALFPVVALLMIASEGQALGRILKGYVYGLLWVELWPVMFAVLNYIATIYSMRHIAASAFSSAGSALTLDTANAIYSNAVSDISVVGYMVTMVPALAAAVLYSMDKIATAVPSGQSLGGAADREAAAAAKGNANQGVVNMDSYAVDKRMSDPMMYTNSNHKGSVSGTVGSDGSGDVRIKHNMSSGPLSIKDVVQQGKAASVDMGHNLQQADVKTKAAEEAIGATFATTLGLMKQAGVGAAKGTGVDLNKVHGDGTTDSDVQEVSADLAKTLKTSDTGAVAKVLRGSAGVEIAGTGLSASASAERRTAAEAAVTEARRALQKRGVNRQIELSEKFSSGESFKSVRDSNRAATDKIDASLSKAKTFRDGANASLTEARTNAKMLRASEAISRDTSYDYGIDLYKFLHRKGMDLETNPALLQSAAREFLLSGEIQHIDGMERFSPPMGGEGPNIMTTVKQDVGANSEEALRARQAAANPQGGAAAVEQRDAANKGKVASAQAASGLNPNTMVTDGGLIAKEKQAAEAAAAHIEKTKKDGETAKTELDAQSAQQFDKLKPDGTPLKASHCTHLVSYRP